MSKSSITCRLCLNICNSYKSLYYEDGFPNEVYKLTEKYFTPKGGLIFTAICMECWYHIYEFRAFQVSVFKAQRKLGEVERIARVATKRKRKGANVVCHSTVLAQVSKNTTATAGYVQEFKDFVQSERLVDEVEFAIDLLESVVTPKSGGSANLNATKFTPDCGNDFNVDNSLCEEFDGYSSEVLEATPVSMLPQGRGNVSHPDGDANEWDDIEKAIGVTTITSTFIQNITTTASCVDEDPDENAVLFLKLDDTNLSESITTDVSHGGNEKTTSSCVDKEYHFFVVKQGDTDLTGSISTTNVPHYNKSTVEGDNPILAVKLEDTNLLEPISTKVAHHNSTDSCVDDDDLGEYPVSVVKLEDTNLLESIMPDIPHGNEARSKKVEDTCAKISSGGNISEDYSATKRLKKLNYFTSGTLVDSDDTTAGFLGFEDEETKSSDDTSAASDDTVGFFTGGEFNKLDNMISSDETSTASETIEMSHVRSKLKRKRGFIGTAGTLISRKKYLRRPQTGQEFDDFIAKWRPNLECVLCSEFKCTAYSQLLEHFDNVHLYDRCRIRCCQEVFYQPYEIVNHIYYHQEPLAFKCDVCFKVYTKNSDLEDHYKEHLHSKLRKRNETCKCPKCPKSYATKQTLLDNHTKCDDHPSDKSPSKGYVCSKCGNVYASLTTLRKHKQTIHLENTYNKNFAKDPVSFKRIKVASLRQHITTHTEGVDSCYNCTHCPKKFKNYNTLYTHIKRKHTKEWLQERRNKRLLHKCTTCEKVCRTSKALLKHMTVHMEKDLHSCNYCSKTFKYKYKLRNHLLDEHNEKRKNKKR